MKYGSVEIGRFRDCMVTLRDFKRTPRRPIEFKTRKTERTRNRFSVDYAGIAPTPMSRIVSWRMWQYTYPEF